MSIFAITLLQFFSATVGFLMGYFLNKGGAQFFRMFFGFLLGLIGSLVVGFFVLMLIAASENPYDVVVFGFSKLLITSTFGATLGVYYGARSRRSGSCNVAAPNGERNYKRLLLVFARHFVAMVLVSAVFNFFARPEISFMGWLREVVFILFLFPLFFTAIFALFFTRFFRASFDVMIWSAWILLSLALFGKYSESLSSDQGRIMFGSNFNKESNVDEFSGNLRDAARPPFYLPIDPVVVNLADKSGDRIAQIGITLQLKSEEDGERVKVHLSLIEDEIINLASRKLAAQLASSDGKISFSLELKNMIRIKAGVSPESVLFSSIIVQ